MEPQAWCMVAIDTSLLPAIPHGSATGAPCWGVGQSPETVLPVQCPPNSPEGGVVSTALSLDGIQAGSQGLHEGSPSLNPVLVTLHLSTTCRATMRWLSQCTGISLRE